MSITFYHYPNCDTCRKARKWLDHHGVTYQAVDIVREPPQQQVLKRVLALSERPVKALFNTSGESYRKGGFKEKLPTLTLDEALNALAADGKLIKRPLLVTPALALIGFREEAYAQANL